MVFFKTWWFRLSSDIFSSKPDKSILAARAHWRAQWLCAAMVACFHLTGPGLSAQKPPAPTAQAPGSPASNAQILSSYEGQNVTAIEIAGRPQSATADFASLFVQKAGKPFSADEVNQTAAALKAATKATDVRVQVDAEANGLRVQFIIEPAVYFGIFEFPGAKQFHYSRLTQVANFQAQTPFNADDVEQDRKALLTFFRQHGYFKATVDAEVKVDESNGLANIFFGVNLNRPAKFGDIKIAGTSPEETAALDHSLQTLGARFRGAGIRPRHPYHSSTLSKATQYLQARLQKEDYLGAEVKLAGAEYHADTNRADIHFTVTPGAKSKIEINGAHLWSWTRKALLPEYQGVGVDEESVEEGRQALISHFQAEGFFDAKVDAQVKQDGQTNTVIYQISKEKKHKVSSVELSGNHSLPSSQLTSQLTVEKSHLFSPGKFSKDLVRSSEKNLKAVYESEGFSSVQVTSSVSNNGGDITVGFRVNEGPRDIVSSLTIEGDDKFPQSQFAPKGLKVIAGQPYSQAHVEADRTEIVSHYWQAGYLKSSFRETATEASKNDPHHINVVYHIYEGPKVIAGKLITLGRTQTKQRLIDQDVSGIKPGAPLTESELLTAGSNLYDHTGVFDWAEVDPKRQITTQDTEDVVVRVHEANRNEITYGIGFEVINRGGSIPSGTIALPGLPPVGLPSSFTSSQVTFWGPRGSIQYTRNNVGGKGDSLSFTGFAGRLDQRGAGYYIVPNFLWSKWKATTSFSAERNEENPIFSLQQELASAQVQRPLDKAKKNTLFLRYSFSKTDLPRVLIPDLVPAADQHVRLSTLAANLTRDTRDNALDEHKGVLQSIELDFNDTKLGSSVDFAKLTGQAAYYKQGFHNIVWANSIRVGLAQPFTNSRVPLSEEFFSGGGNSLRGFPLDGAGPQRDVEVCPDGIPGCKVFIKVPEGGHELLIINSEARIPLPVKKGLGLVVFYDGGNVFPNVGFRDFTSLYSNNVGLGLRYATPVGPIRFDLGQNLNPVTGVKSTNYFISIGQAF
jgi:outer membrane protein insertion porin family